MANLVETLLLIELDSPLFRNKTQIMSAVDLIDTWLLDKDQGPVFSDTACNWWTFIFALKSVRLQMELMCECVSI